MWTEREGGTMMPFHRVAGVVPGQPLLRPLLLELSPCLRSTTRSGLSRRACPDPVANPSVLLLLP